MTGSGRFRPDTTASSVADASCARAEGLQRLAQTELPHDAVSRVSCRGRTVYYPSLRAAGTRHVVIINCGMKKNIVRSLCRRGCMVTVVPWNTSAREIRAILSGVHYRDGVQIRDCAAQNRVVMLTSLDTVRMLLDVLEEMTMGISTIDAE